MRLWPASSGKIAYAGAAAITALPWVEQMFGSIWNGCSIVQMFGGTNVRFQVTEQMFYIIYRAVDSTPVLTCPRLRLLA